MTPELRRNAILSLVTTQGELSIEHLAKEFGVSLQTLRSDIRELTEQGLILRRHGLVAPFARENIGYGQRGVLNIDGKRWIGTQVATHLQDATSCALGTGTTVAMVARALPVTSSLSIFTNNLHAAECLSQLPDCDLYIAGGKVRKRDLDVIGGAALVFFGQYRVAIGVVSVGGIGEGGELYDFNDDEVMARQALMGCAAVNILVVDSSKFGRSALCQNGSIADFDYVVSDRLPTPAQQALLQRLGTQWVGP